MQHRYPHSENTPRHAIRFLLQHLLVGSIGGFVFGAALLYYDVAGLKGLILGSSEPVVAIFLLFFGLFITFGSVAMGVGVFGLAEERDE